MKKMNLTGVSAHGVELAESLALLLIHHGHISLIPNDLDQLLEHSRQVLHHLAVQKLERIEVHLPAIAKALLERRGEDPALVAMVRGRGAIHRNSSLYRFAVMTPDGSLPEIDELQIIIDRFGNAKAVFDPEKNVPFTLEINLEGMDSLIALRDEIVAISQELEAPSIFASVIELVDELNYERLTSATDVAPIQDELKALRNDIRGLAKEIGAGEILTSTLSRIDELILDESSRAGGWQPALERAAGVFFVNALAHFPEVTSGDCQLTGEPEAAISIWLTGDAAGHPVQAHKGFDEDFFPAKSQIDTAVTAGVAAVRNLLESEFGKISDPPKEVIEQLDSCLRHVLYFNYPRQDALATSPKQ